MKLQNYLDITCRIIRRYDEKNNIKRDFIDGVDLLEVLRKDGNTGILFPKSIQEEICELENIPLLNQLSIYMENGRPVPYPQSDSYKKMRRTEQELGIPGAFTKKEAQIYDKNTVILS